MTIDIPWRTLFRIIAAAALVWLLLELIQVILLLVVAVLLAVSLDPVVCWLERHKMSRGTAAFVVTLGTIITTGVFLWFTWASLVAQWQYVADYFTKLGEQLPELLPPALRGAVQSATSSAWSTLGPYVLAFVQSASGAVAVLLLGFVLTIYLLTEGRRTHQWLLAFVPLEYRSRVHRTVEECREVMVGYVTGNVITSVICTVVTLVALLVLGVPAALLLALLAGISDFVPVIGFFASMIPAVLLALTVSPKVALAVVVVYIAYNTVENYILSPWAYGSRMKLSNLAVILAFVVGAELAGVIGALVALPVAAIYPTIERLWLRSQLPDETVAEHRALEANPES